MEVGEAVLPLNLVDAKFDFAERLFLLFAEVAERDLNDTTLEGVVCIFCVDECESAGCR
jgi:hypothetical protein